MKTGPSVRLPEESMNGMNTKKLGEKDLVEAKRMSREGHLVGMPQWLSQLGV